MPHPAVNRSSILSPCLSICLKYPTPIRRKWSLTADQRKTYIFFLACLFTFQIVALVYKCWWWRWLCFFVFWRKGRLQGRWIMGGCGSCRQRATLLLSCSALPPGCSLSARYVLLCAPCVRHSFFWPAETREQIWKQIPEKYLQGKERALGDDEGRAG